MLATNGEVFLIFIPASNVIMAYKLSTGTVVDTVTTSSFSASQLDEVQVAQIPEGDEIWIAHREHEPTRLVYDPVADTWGIYNISFTSKPAEWTGSNWPGTIEFHQGRSWWGGTPNEPETFWASVSGDYKDISLGVGEPADAIKYTLSNRGAICWIKSHRKLLIGTENAEYDLESEGGVLITEDIEAIRQSGYGSAYRQPVLAGNKVLYVSSDRKKVYDINYQWTEDGWVSRDITFVSDHIFNNDRIKRIAYAPTENLLLAVTDGGNLVMATYERGNDIIGWQRHPTRGSAIAIGSVDYLGRSYIGGSFDRVSRSVGIYDVSEIEIMEEGIYFDSCEKVVGTNLVPNPSFETDLSDWTAENNALFTRHGGDSSDGQWSAKVESQSTADPRIKTSTIATGTGKDFRIKADVYVNPTIVNGLYKFVNIYVCDDILELNRIYASEQLKLNETGWHTLEAVGTTGATDSGSVKVIFELSTVDAGDWLLLDNVRLTLDTLAVTGIDRFANYLISCKIDGAVYPNVQFDSNGDATLPATGSDVQLGFNYVSKFKSLPIQHVSQGGSNIPLMKSFGMVHTLILSSAYPKINGIRPPERVPGTPMDTPEALKTEYIKVSNLGYAVDARIELEQDLPLKTKVAGFYSELEESLL